MKNANTIANKAERYVENTLGLRIEAIKSMKSNSMHCSVFDSKSQILRMLKAAGARINKFDRAARAIMPNGGIVQVEWDLSVPRNERCCELFLETDDDQIYCTELAEAMQGQGFDIKAADVRVWYDGEGDGNGPKAERAFRKLLGRHRYARADATARMTDVVAYALGLSKQKTVGGIDVSLTEKQIVAMQVH